MQQERKYYLVIRVGKNSFLPIDWSQTKYYEGENLYSLSGIDHFTSKVLSLDLLKECLRIGLLKEDDLFSSMEILYIENDKNHTIKEGPIFLEDSYIMGEDSLIDYVIANKNNKEEINNIIMQCSIKESNQKLEEFKLILRGIGKIPEEDEILREYLNVFKELSYEQKRCICKRLSESIYKSNNRKQSKEKVLHDNRKVA